MLNQTPIKDQANEFMVFLYGTFNNPQDKATLKRAFQSDNCHKKACLLVSRKCPQVDFKFLESAVVTGQLFADNGGKTDQPTFARQFGKYCLKEDSYRRRWEELMDARDRTFTHRLQRLIKLMRSKYPHANFNYRQLFIDLSMMQTSLREDILSKWYEDVIGR
jgi:hypothetical protein